MSLAHGARMRIVSLLMVSAAVVLTACSGATADSGSPGGSSASTTTTPGSTTGNDAKPGANDPPVIHPPINGKGPGIVGAACAAPTSVSVGPGGTIARPTGSALRLQLVYQGADIGVTEARGVDMILPPASGPFEAGKVAGYWVEARTATGASYQHFLQDPTMIEAVGEGGGSFTNITVDKCTAKTILADVPNDPSTTELRVYGSPYGTNDGAVELARFTLK